MDYVVTALREHPELAIFLTLAVGFLLGRVRIGSFSLGTVVGTLLAGVLIGQLDIKVPPIVKAVFFDLFLFTTGSKVGPQFFRGLKKDALPQLAITVVLCVTCLISAFIASKLLGRLLGNIMESGQSIGITLDRPGMGGGIAGAGDGVTCPHCAYPNVHPRAAFCPKCGMRMSQP